MLQIYLIQLGFPPKNPPKDNSPPKFGQILEDYYLGSVNKTL